MAANSTQCVQELTRLGTKLIWSAIQYDAAGKYQQQNSCTNGPLPTSLVCETTLATTFPATVKAFITDKPCSNLPQTLLAHCRTMSANKNWTLVWSACRDNNVKPTSLASLGQCRRHQSCGSESNFRKCNTCDLIVSTTGEFVNSTWRHGRHRLEPTGAGIGQKTHRREEPFRSTEVP